MPWWGWMSLGFFLMGAELVGVDAAFYLIFIGVAGVATGLLGLAGVDMPAWAQWLTFSVFAIASMVLFRAKLYEKLHGGSPGYGNTLIGERVEIPDALQSGDQGRVELRGSKWTAINVGDQTIAAGETCEVVDTDGMTLKVRPIRRAEQVDQ